MTTNINITSDIESALRTWLRTPDGSWPETEQAWARIVEAAPARASVEKLTDRALSAPWHRHPSRRDDSSVYGRCDDAICCGCVPSAS